MKVAGPLGWLRRAFAVASAVFWASHARAQDVPAHEIKDAPWSPYSRSVYSEGDGLPINERQALHLGAALEGGYDTNVYYRSRDVIGASLLRLRGRINLATRPPADADAEIRAADPEIAYRLPLQFEFRQYLGSDRARGQSFNVLSDPALTIWPAGPVSIDLADTFVHTVDPRNAETFGRFTRDSNRVSLVGRVRIGGGRLELGAGGSLQTTFWDSRDVHYANDVYAEAQAFTRWHFDTELAATLRVRAGYLRYRNLPVLDSRPLRALLVVEDKVSRWLRFSAGAGYGNSFNVAGSSFSGPLATAQVDLTTPSDGTVTLAYERDFFQSLLANFYTDDHFMLAYAQPFEGDFTARAEGGVRLRQYQDLLPPAVVGFVGYNASARTDTIYEGNLELAYHPRPWFTAALTYNVQVDDTRFAFLTDGGAVEARYVKHSIFLRGEFGN